MCQEVKYKIIDFIEVERDENGEKFSEPKKTSAYFKVDFDDLKITIPTLDETIIDIVRNSKTPIPIPNHMDLKIISRTRSYKDSEKNKYSVFIGMFRDGHMYMIKLIEYAKQKDNGVQAQIVIEGDWLYTYNVINFE